jgi:hypothetical protein
MTKLILLLQLEVEQKAPVLSAQKNIRSKDEELKQLYNTQ